MGNITKDKTSITNRLKRILHSAKSAPIFKERLAVLKTVPISSEKDFCQRVPLLQWEDLEAMRTSSGDPFGGRKTLNRNTHLTFQLENDAEFPLYVSMDRKELQCYADALTLCWQLLGLSKGDRVAVFDYGSSPLSYLASSSYMPYLSKGAAENLGCVPVCNDGVSQMSQRAIEIARFVRPKVFFLRSDCLFPFSQEAKRQAVSLSHYISAVVIAENDGLALQGSCLEWEATWGVPVYRLLRVDAAMFMGIECPSCQLMHVPNNLYFIETVCPAGPADTENDSCQIAITNLFARSTPAIRYVSQVRGFLAGRGCPKKPEDERVKLL